MSKIFRTASAVPSSNADDINFAAHTLLATVSRGLEIQASMNYPASLTASTIGAVVFAACQLGGLSETDARFATKTALDALASSGAFADLGSCVVTACEAFKGIEGAAIESID